VPDAVDPLTHDIANAFALAGGRPAMDDAVLAAHLEAVAACDAARRNTIAIELVALAQRLVATEQDAWDAALVQLALLIGLCFGDLSRAATALTDGGMDAARARALIGAAASSIPVGTGPRPAGAVSPLNAMLRNLSQARPKKPQEKP
jgi:hypothetical protein